MLAAPVQRFSLKNDSDDGGPPRRLSGKIKSPSNAGDMGSIPGSGRSPGEGNGNPLQDSCLENPMDRGAWWVTVHGVTKSWTRLNIDYGYTLTCSHCFALDVLVFTFL